MKIEGWPHDFSVEAAQVFFHTMQRINSMQVQQVQKEAEQQIWVDPETLAIAVVNRKETWIIPDGNVSLIKPLAKHVPPAKPVPDDFKDPSDDEETPMDSLTKKLLGKKKK